MALIDDFVIQKILRHLGLWEDERTRGARPLPEPEATEITAEPFLEDLPYGNGTQHKDAGPKRTQRTFAQGKGFLPEKQADQAGNLLTEHPVPEFLATDWVLGMFGVYRKPAQRKYRDFVLAALEEDGGTPWEELQGQILLGTEEFVSRFWKLIGDRERIEEIPKRERYVGRPGLESLFSGKQGGREGAALVAYRGYGYTQKEISAFLGVHHTTVSRWIREQE